MSVVVLEPNEALVGTDLDEDLTTKQAQVEIQISWFSRLLPMFGVQDCYPDGPVCQNPNLHWSGVKR